MGYHEEMGKVWNGRNWSVGFKEQDSEFGPAIALFADGSEMNVVTMLFGDLQSKGLVQASKPVAKASAKGKSRKSSGSNTFWHSLGSSGERLAVKTEKNTKKEEFAVLLVDGNRKCQLTCKSTGLGLDQVLIILKEVALVASESKNFEKKYLYEIRDKKIEDRSCCRFQVSAESQGTTQYMLELQIVSTSHGSRSGVSYFKTEPTTHFKL